MKFFKKAADAPDVSEKPFDVSPLREVRCPGLTPGAVEVAVLADRMPRELSVLSYKRGQQYLWVVFLGGTGTGKSTLFNAFCGGALSDAGVERPKTRGPVAYAFKGARVDEDFPIPGMRVKRMDEGEAAAPTNGEPGVMLIVEHTREELSHLILVDTPDMDSLEMANRRMVEDLYLLSDAVVFVTSQEKYADGLPFQFLNRIQADGKLYFLLVNKTEPILGSDEVPTILRREGLDVSDERFFTVPYLPAEQLKRLAEHESVVRFVSVFQEYLGKARLFELLGKEKTNRVRRLSREFNILSDLLEKEEQAARRWVGDLETFLKSTCRELFSRQERHFAEESREYLQQEIRRLYARYDLLGRPRRFVSLLIRTPFRFLGLSRGPSRETHREALLRIRRQADLTPILAAVESFNLSVLEKLSPENQSSPLHSKLREQVAVLTGTEVRKLVWVKQDELIQWLDGTFNKLAKGIPKSKELGIYSTSILWGGLILSLETAIGGGISLLEAVLDSAVAPFVTKGAVELFAYRELQMVARELGRRYQEGMMSVVEEQRNRYVAILQSLMISSETVSALHSLHRRVADAA